MLVPYSWLKDYVDIKATATEVADKLTSAGIEVENIFSLSKGVKNVITGKVISVNQHPTSERLFICIINTGNAVKTIVTAATNVTPEAIVPLALPGAVLAGDKEIGSADFKGVVSEGMLCSAQELGIGPELLTVEEREGILILPQDTAIGEDINHILALTEPILELSLTPNRSDCLAMINVAREIAADFELTANIKKPSIIRSDSSVDKINIEIANPDLCLRYIGKIVSNIKIGPSPLWLQNRLRQAGVRPINNIVDVTNYIMLEYGQPMHAFDYELLSGKKIIVRNATQGEKINTLDGIERTLDSDTLVIADAEKAVAIAGIMGGGDTEVTTETRTVLLESAYFEGSSIRRNSRKLGLRSESSHRFEKGVDIIAVEEAMNRAAELLEEISAGSPSKDSVDIFPAGYQKEEVAITVQEVNSLLGTQLGADIIEKTFSRLQFPWVKQDGKYIVQIPSYRRDISRMVDLVEEVARLYGYNNIPTTLPIGQSTQVYKTKEQLVEEVIIEALIACGLNEVITYSFINPQWLDKLLIAADDKLRDAIEVQNPLNEDQKVMRTSIIPGLMETVQRNFARRNTNLNIFEMGRVFLPPMSPLPEEKPHLAIFIGGTPVGDWNNKQRENNFFDIKGIVEAMFVKLNIKVQFEKTEEIPYFHPGRTARIIIDGATCGYLGEVHPQVAENYDFPVRGYACEIDLLKVIDAADMSKVYKALPKYPAVTRDLALLAPVEVSADTIAKVITDNAGELLQKFFLFDVYAGEQIAQGFKSLAYSLTYQSNLKTLTDEEISSVQDKILTALNKLGITLR